MVEYIDSSDVSDIDNRHNRRLYLEGDFICINCGVIFNSCYQENCMVCKVHDYVHECGCNEYVTGKLSISIRSILDFHIQDLKALNSIYGYNNSSRSQMVINIISSIYPNLDKRINKTLIKKIILRNHKKFSFLRDIDAAMRSVKRVHMTGKSTKLNFVSTNDIIVEDKDSIEKIIDHLYSIFRSHTVESSSDSLFSALLLIFSASAIHFTLTSCSSAFAQLFII